jgi:hypothetical protein
MVFPGVTTRLSYKGEDGKLVPLATSTQGSWVIKNATSGTYQFEIVDSAVKVNGKLENLQGERSKTFTLNPNQRAQIKVILKKTPVGLIIVLVVLVVVLIVWLIIAMKDHHPDLPKILAPPIPGVNVPVPKAIPLPLLLPIPPVPHHVPIPIPIFIDGGYYACPDDDLPADAGEQLETVQPPPSSAEAIDFRPVNGSANIPADEPILIYFSAPMDEMSLRDPKAIQVSGSKSGSIHGYVIYHSRDSYAEFIAPNGFMVGETVTVSMTGQLLKDATGQPMALNYEWSFSIGK